MFPSTDLTLVSVVTIDLNKLLFQMTDLKKEFFESGDLNEELLLRTALNNFQSSRDLNKKKSITRLI